MNTHNRYQSTHNPDSIRLVLEPVTTAEPDWYQDEPDEHWAVYNDGEQTGHCSLWWRNAPSYPGHRVGMVGHFSAADEFTASRLLAKAEERLAIQGCTFVVGPMDGSTWKTYRAVTWRGAHPQFFLEPDIMEPTARWFRDNGYKSIASYYSCESSTLIDEKEKLAVLSSRFARHGVTVRAIDFQDYDNELSRIYSVCDEAFRNGFLYSPLDKSVFKALYQPIKRWATPELILLAERKGETIGFLFAIPDLSQLQRGQPIDTVIYKTLAVRPEYSGRGLGIWLIAQGYRAAQERGYHRVIHAFMHADNVSLKMSRHRYKAKIIREYGLFGKETRHEPV